MTCKPIHHRPSHMLSVLLMAVISWWPSLRTCGQDTDTPDRVVTNTKMIGLGSINMLDTYLSPEKYKGADIRYFSHTIREVPGDKWSQEIMHQGIIGEGSDRADDGTLMTGLYSLTYVLQRSWQLSADRLGITLGGMADFSIGGTFSARNQNNPAQLRLSMQLGPSASATYRFKLWKKPFSARYECSAPLVGLMFSPNYGQSYYEIFSRGNYEHNAVVTSPFSAPSMRNMLTLDTRIWGTTLRIGYLCDIQQAKVNGLKQHFYTHALLIGFVRHFKTKTIK